MKTKIGGFQYQGTYESANLELYMNPASVKRLGPWARAISDKEGNLFVASPVENIAKTRHYVATTHNVLIEELGKLGYCKDVKWINPGGLGGYGYYENGMVWHQYMNTKYFYLSESYDISWIEDHKEEVESYIKNINKSNVKFKLERVPTGTNINN